MDQVRIMAAKILLEESVVPTNSEAKIYYLVAKTLLQAYEEAASELKLERECHA